MTIMTMTYIYTKKNTTAHMNIWIATTGPTGYEFTLFLTTR